MSYVSISQSISYNSYELVPVRKSDMEQIRVWRNEQMEILRQKNLLTKEDQQEYYKNHVLASFERDKPSKFILSYLERGRLVGYGGLYNVDWEHSRAEVSFLLNPELTKDTSTYASYFKPYFTMIKQLAFDELKFNRIYTETFDMRPEHISLLEECSFMLEGRMKKHVLINNQYIDSLIHGAINPN